MLSIANHELERKLGTTDVTIIKLDDSVRAKSVRKLMNIKKAVYKSQSTPTYFDAVYPRMYKPSVLMYYVSTTRGNYVIIRKSDEKYFKEV